MAPLLSASKRELLTQKIVFNHEILTHRVVARSFKIEASKARALLREFHESSDGRTHATYIVTGYVKPDEPIALDGPPVFVPANGVSSSAETDGSNQAGPELINGTANEEADVEMEGTAGHSQPASYSTELKIHAQAEQEDIHCVALIPEDELEERLRRFSKVLSSEIYSLEASKLPDLILLTDANSRILSEPELAQVDGSVVGTIAHYREKPKRGGKAIKASTSTSAAKTDKKANTSQPELKRKASSSADLNAKTASTSKATSANSSKAASPADSKKSKGALGSMFAKGEEKNKAAAKEKEEKKAASSSIAKGKKKKDDEQKMDVDGEEDEYADLMADDDDLMAEIDGIDNGKVSTANKGKKASGAKEAGAPSTSGSKNKGKASGTRKGGDGKVRKIRRVKKTIKTKNAKGYMESKQVSTDEEYTASEEGGEDDDHVVVASSSMQRSESSTSNKEKKPAASSSNAGTKKPAASAKNAKPGEQSSLKNFFGKPKASSSKK